MISFQRLKLDMEADIDGMLVNEEKKSASILKKFLVFNFTVFAVLGLFTILYLKAIQPNLVKNRVSNHNIIIQNTNDHLQRLNVSFEEESIKTFYFLRDFYFKV